VTSFKLEKGEKEVFFMSSKAIFDPSKPIRGGIPICYPQFGPGKLPQHGFARTSNDWTVIQTSSPSSNDVSLTLALADTEDSRKIWNHSFSVKMSVRISYDEIQKSQFFQNLEVTNTGNNDFDFTTALHTYFTTPSIHTTSVTPMKNLNYFDKVKGKLEQETNDAVQFTGHTDRVYHSAPNELTIHTATHTTTITKTNFDDAVLWNAWAELCKNIADLGDDDWKSYVCCEVGNIATPVTLSPGKLWKAGQRITRKPAVHAND